MWKFHVLFLVFSYFSVKESNAYYNYEDTKTWTLGSAVDVVFGAEDAVYCKLEHNHRLIYDGFGPCRVVVDRVTRDHHGRWVLRSGVPGTVIVRNRDFFVDVVEAPAVDATLEVTGTVTGKDSTVILQCTVPEEHEVISCAFSDPAGNIYIATPGVNQEGNNQVMQYESFVERNGCTLTLLTPIEESSGRWRCAVSTTQATSHGFFLVNRSILNPDASSYYPKPELQSAFSFLTGMEGDAKTMSCSIDAIVRYCYFRAPNGTVFSVGPTTSSPGYEYVGNGFDAGECGIRFNNIWTSDEGLWSCNVGLIESFEEQRAFFNFYVNQRLAVHHRWSGSAVAVRLHIFDGPKLEYCRFVRSDGLGFSSESAPPQYSPEWGEHYGACGLSISNPIAEDLRPWTIVTKVIGEDGEVTATTTLDPRGHPSRGLSPTAAILLWSFFGTIFIFLIGVSCLPKKNRDWANRNAARIRNSFRRHPQPQPQPPQHNVTDIPRPVHTDILTDLPIKY